MKPDMACAWCVFSTSSHAVSCIMFEEKRTRRSTLLSSTMSGCYSAEAKLSAVSALIRAADSTSLERLGNLSHLLHRLSFQMEEEANRFARGAERMQRSRSREHVMNLSPWKNVGGVYYTTRLQC